MPRGPPPPQLCRGVEVVSRRELRAAGITDPRLQEAYEQCRRLNASHGRTYYLATLLLPPAKRPYVHALYGFARYADELVDDLRSPDPDRAASFYSGVFGWDAKPMPEGGADYRLFSLSGTDVPLGGMGGNDPEEIVEPPHPFDQIGWTYHPATA